ncbi:arginine deiminase [Liberiplasma polymorphum]|uniref:arginine deiminase n=1 Tax=Liberiplasma polymorphum TaxID=3374570 RepID=UPI003774A9EB
MKPNVYSEIGKLKTVLLHRPGKELENLTPTILEKLLFDDIPYLKVAQEEHDAFAETLRNEGVEVLYITEMVKEALEANPEIIDEFIRQFIDEAQVKSKSVKESIFKFLKALPPLQMVEKMIAGIRTHDFKANKPTSIMDMLEDEYPFFTDPMPNILFQRDPFATIGKGVSIHKMYTDTRRRETIFSEYMFNYHPRFKDENIPKYYKRDNRYNIEGGDILILNKETLAIGISKRTDPRAIQHLAETLFETGESFKTILAFNIPKTRAFMHLDTVFTQVDYGVFAIHPGIMKVLTIFEVTKNKDGVHVTKVVTTLEAILEKHLNRKIELIHCGGSDIVHSEREQWNDGANTLTVEPGKVIVYSRNHITNELFKQKGIKVLEIPSSELSRGRGGPRCMSMPIFREDLK